MSLRAFTETPYFGIAISVAAYWLGSKIQEKTGWVLCNPLLLGGLITIAALQVFQIPYESYDLGGSLINMCLAPATVCLAVTIYAKIDLLKQYWLPVLVGCITAVTVSVGSILLMCRLFDLDTAMTLSLMPKSVTTPIATAVAESTGGIVPITVAAVCCTGMMGNLAAPGMIRLFKIREPMAAGLGIGACSHAMGTARALELGETEGAMSGLALSVCGLLTAIAALIFPYIAGL